MQRPTVNDEMVLGFMDGYDLSSPEPSENRSHSYRHGFKAGRNDILPYGSGPFHGLAFETVLKLADEAMKKDAERAL